MRLLPFNLHSFDRRLLWALPALAAGGLLGYLPVHSSAALLGGLVLAGLAVWEPAIGLGAAVIFGPAKAFITISFPGLPVDVGQIFFALAAAGWLARGLSQRRLCLPQIGLLVPLGLYLLIGLFSLLPAVSLEEGLKEALKWAEIAASLVILYTEAERGRARWIVAALLLAGLAQAGLGWWEYQGHGPEHFRIDAQHFRAYGSFEQPNPYGGFLGLIWPVAAGLALGSWQLQTRLKPLPTGRRLFTWDGWKVELLGRWEFSFSPATLLLPPLVLFLLGGLYVSFSRGAWLGAVAAAGVLLLFTPRRLRLGLALAAAGLLGSYGLIRAGLMPASITNRLASVTDFLTVTDVRGININDVNFSLLERLAHWQAAQAMADAHPWLGVGLGNYGAVYADYSLLNWPNALGHAHNIYLNVLAETGALGLGAYLLWWGSVIALTIRTLRRASGWPRGLALGLLGAWAHLSAHQLVDNLYVNNIHFLIAALLALLVWVQRQADQSPLTGAP